MTPFIGMLVWLCQMPNVGPIAGIVTHVEGQTIAAWAMERDSAGPMVDVTPWPVEDGTLWGWLPIPADGQVPADLFL